MTRANVRSLALGCVLASTRAVASPSDGARVASTRVPSVCDSRVIREPGAPARIGALPAGLGALPEACPGTDISLHADASLLIATDDFYGSIAASVALRGRYAFSRHAWFALAFPGVDYRYVANATVTADSVDLGATAASLHVAIPFAQRASLAPYFRLMLPTETVFVNAVRYGFDHGVSLTLRVAPRVELLAGATFPVLFTETAGRTQARYEPGTGVEISYTPWRFLTFIGGASARFRYGDDRAFESFDPTLALRFFALRGLRAELAARAPLFGADRTDLGVALNIGWIFGDSRASHDPALRR